MKQLTVLITCLACIMTSCRDARPAISVTDFVDEFPLAAKDSATLNSREIEAGVYIIVSQDGFQAVHFINGVRHESPLATEGEWEVVKDKKVFIAPRSTANARAISAALKHSLSMSADVFLVFRPLNSATPVYLPFQFLTWMGYAAHITVVGDEWTARGDLRTEAIDPEGDAQVCVIIQPDSSSEAFLRLIATLNAMDLRYGIQFSDSPFLGYPYCTPPQGLPYPRPTPP